MLQLIIINCPAEVINHELSFAHKMSVQTLPEWLVWSLYEDSMKSNTFIMVSWGTRTLGMSL